MLRYVNLKALLPITLMLLSLLAAAPTHAAEQLRIASLAPKNSSYHKALLEVAEAWKKTQAADAKIAIFTDGSQGGESDMIRKIRIGQLQGGFISLRGLRESMPEASAMMSIPLLFKTWDEVDFVREKLRGDIEKQARERGFVIIAWADGGWIRFLSKEPAAVPSDFIKMKMYAWTEDTDQIDIMKKVGYNPIPLESLDMLPALQTGLIDALQTTAYYALAAQMGKQAPNMLDVHWAPLMGALVISKKAWDGMNQAGRDALIQAGEVAGNKIRQAGRREDSESLEALRKAGVNITTPNAEQAKAWENFAQEAKKYIRGKMVAAETFDKIEALLKAHR